MARTRPVGHRRPVGRVLPVQPRDRVHRQVRLDGRPHGRVEGRVAELLVDPVVLEPVLDVSLELREVELDPGPRQVGEQLLERVGGGRVDVGHRLGRDD